VQAFVNAEAKGAKYVSNPANKANVLKILAKYIPGISQATLEQTWDIVSSRPGAFDQTISASQMQAEVKYLQFIGVVPQSFNPSYNEIVANLNG
jgi:hypothetical protein